MNEIYNNFDAI